MRSARAFLKAILPAPIVQKLANIRNDRFKSQMKGKTSQEIFSEIYKQGIWGGAEAGGKFYSGSGSHDAEIVGHYLEAVSAFLQSLPEKPDVVDLGCGDFAVGRQIRPLCARYTACDIVPALIDHHRENYADLDVQFEVVNLATDPLPPGDIAFVRQVLQHMSNAEIAAALPKLAANYRYLIVTEHEPDRPFTPNADKATGADIRTNYGSGVDLTAPPFSLAPIEERQLCEVSEFGAKIRTYLYRLK